MFAPLRARTMLLLSLAACSGPPAAPVAIEPVAERADRGDSPPDVNEKEEAVVVEGNLPAPVKEAPPGQATKPPTKPGFALPTGLEATSVVVEGDELFYVAGRYGTQAGRVGRIDRKGDEATHTGPRGRLQIVGPKAARIAVVTGPQGGFAFFEGGKWIYRLAPALEGETVTGVVRTQDGRFLLAGTEHALYELSGDAWKTFRYPSSGNSFTALAEAKDGTLLLVGAHGRVVEFDGNAFTDLKIPGLGTGPFTSTWVDTERHEVWLSTQRELVKLALATKTATSFSSPLFFELKGMTGGSTAKGPLIVGYTFGRVALFDGKDWSEISSSGADFVGFDVAKAQAYVGSTSGRLEIFDVKHAWLGTGVHTPITR